jgi:hypothetical protein
MTLDARVLLAGALITPRYRAALGADPGNQDKATGYDYNPGWLKTKLPEVGGAAEGYSLTPAGPESFKVELARGGMKKAYTLKLVKGATAGRWQVDEFLPQ